MNTLLITYDLVALGRDYSRLWSFLELYDIWAKPVRSVYLIKTTQSAESFRNSVIDYVNRNGKIFVVDVTSRAAVWNHLSAKVNTWIKNSL